MATISDDITAIVSGTTANVAQLLSVLRRIAVNFDSMAEVEEVSISSDVKRIFCSGYDAAGDGGALSLTVWTGAGEPGHPAGKVQSADGRWWVNDDIHPNPLQFGAKWDYYTLKTNDAPAINLWAQFIRYARREGVMPGGSAYAASTLYLGGATFRGAGGVKNKDATYLSGTSIGCDGNPAVEWNSSLAASGTIFGRACSGVTFFDAGGVVTPIDLPDKLSYPFRIGMLIGLGADDLDTENFAGSGGLGGNDLVDITVDGFSGHGVAFVGASGKNRFSHFFVRNCGDAASESLGAHMGCGVYVGMSTVDVDLSGIHVYGHGDKEHGGGVRVGDLKSDSDAAGTSWAPPANVKLGDLYVEGCARPLMIWATFHTKIAWPTLAGSEDYLGVIEFGHPQNPTKAQAIQLVGMKTFNVSHIDVWSGATVIDMYQQQQESASPEFRYRAPITLRRGQAGAFMDSSYRNTLKLIPTVAGIGEIGAQKLSRFVPYLESADEPGHMRANLLPPFGWSALGGVKNGWTGDGEGTLQVLAPHRARVFGGEAIYIDVSGRTAGELMTAALWLDIGAGYYGEIIYGIEDGSDGEVITREFGPMTTSTARVKKRRLFNFIVPASGTVRLWVRSDNPSNYLEVRHPILVPGLLRDPGPELATWPTSQGDVSLSTARFPLSLGGPGSPEGVVEAPLGTIWHRTDGGTGTSFYVKETEATSSTGWVAK